MENLLAMRKNRPTEDLKLLAQASILFCALQFALLPPAIFAQEKRPAVLGAGIETKISRNTPKNAYALGVQLYTAKRYKEASQAFWKAITDEGGEAPAWLYMAHSCMGAGDRTSALKYYQTVYKLYGNRAEGVVAKQYITRLLGTVPPPQDTEESPKLNAPVKPVSLENQITLVRPVVGHPEVDPYLVKEIKNSILKMPPTIKSYLEKARIKIVITPTMIDKYPEGAYQEVAGYEGGTEKSCPGLFNPASREIVMAQHTVSESTDEVERAIPVSFVKETFLHECGHALDFAVSEISLTDDYRFNYYKDIALIPDDVAPRIRYYLQKSERGQVESCGELMGILMGNNRKDSAIMQQSFPNCIAFLKKKLGLF